MLYIPIPDRTCCDNKPKLAPPQRQDGILWRCDECARWWVSYTDYTYWADFSWRPVRWYDRYHKKQIQIAEADEAAKAVAEWNEK